MAIVDDFETAIKNGITAGATAARAQGVNLTQDAINAIEPNLKAVAAELANIAQNRLDGTIGADQAKDDSNDQLGRIPTLVDEAAELAAIALQAIIDAVVKALTTALSKAAGIAL